MIDDPNIAYLLAGGVGVAAAGKALDYVFSADYFEERVYNEKMEYLEKRDASKEAVERMIQNFEDKKEEGSHSPLNSRRHEARFENKIEACKDYLDGKSDEN